MARDFKGRFDNAEEMLRAWREVFDQADRRTVVKPSGEEVRLDVGVDQADAETLVATLGLSTRAVGLLRRVGHDTFKSLV